MSSRPPPTCPEHHVNLKVEALVTRLRTAAIAGDENIGAGLTPLTWVPMTLAPDDWNVPE